MVEIWHDNNALTSLRKIMFSYHKIYTDRQKDRRKDWQRHGRTHTQTDRQTDRRADGQWKRRQSKAPKTFVTKRHL